MGTYKAKHSIVVLTGFYNNNTIFFQAEYE